jgi:DNA-directed RNA polymerase specialized sigma subunit
MKDELKSYLKSKGPKVSEPWRQWKENPTPEAYKAVFDEVKPAVDSAMTSFAGGDQSLRTRAHILTAQAIQSYSPEKGAALKSHVYTTLQRLQRFRSERYRAVRVPENVDADRRAVFVFTAKYKDHHGTDPNIDDITDGMGISRKRVMRTRSREVPEDFQGSDKGDLPALRSRNDVWQDYVYHDLDTRGKQIFELTTGYNGSEVVPKREIARRLKITPAAVSLRVTQIVKQLEAAT